MAGNPVSRSPFPPSAAEARARIAAEREAAREAAIGLGDAEYLSAIDPYIRDNPIARLGLERGEGIDRLRLMPLPPYIGVSPQYLLDTDRSREAVDYYGSAARNFQSLLGSSDPDVRQAAEDYESMYGPEFELDTVLYGTSYNHPAIHAHEFTHRGMAMLNELYPEEVAALYESYNRAPDSMSRRDFGIFREGVTEHFDQPHMAETFNRPVSGRTQSIADTVEEYQTISPSRRHVGVAEGFSEMAARRLEELGETPRVEPEGIMSAIARIFGFGD